jgi:hypothetical protein
MTFSSQSKIWIYQSDRELTAAEVASIQHKLDDFTTQWKAHGHQLNAKAEILYNFFIVFTVDEASASVTGCSIDSSVRIIKEIEQEYKLDLFNRFNIAYKQGDKIVVVPKEDFETMVNIKKIGPDTIVFNNLVATLQEFEHKWEVSFQNSWHSKVFA